MQNYVYTKTFPNENPLDKNLQEENNNHYWTDLHNIITVTGKHGNFTYCDNEKLNTFTITFPKCAGSNIHQRHIWYITCSTHCFKYSIYLPEWTTLRHTTHHCGFSIGDGLDDNIPSKYLCYVNCW